MPPILKISSPKSLSLVIITCFCRSATAKISSSEAFFRISLMKAASYPALLSSLVNFLPRFASTRNTMRFDHRKNFFAFKKLFGVHKSSFYIVIGYIKVFGYFFKCPSLCHSPDNFVNSYSSAPNNRLSHHHFWVYDNSI